MDPLAGFKGPTSKGRGGRGGKGRKGRGRGWGGEEWERGSFRPRCGPSYFFWRIYAHVIG